MRNFLLLVVMVLSPLLSFGQLECVSPPPVNPNVQGNNQWLAYVYQLNPEYDPNGDWHRNFANGNAQRVFKGYLKNDNGDFLPTNSVNFDTRFGDWLGYDNDSSFFGTTDCMVQLQNFGVIFLSKIWIPQEEPGIYRFTVGSDDGTRLKINGEIIHDNWGTGKTYVYDENVVNYYLPFNGGERLNMDLFYYEKTGGNRVSFNFERYFGPGEIEGSQDLCGIAPDPKPFGSRGPASFLEGTVSYQWQYSTVDDPDPSNWNDIPGASGLVYDVPAYQPENDPDHALYNPDNGNNGPGSWSGVRYFRRVATNTTPDGLQNTFASNVLAVNISLIDDRDQHEFGQNAWIGHIYRGKGDFSDNAYLGRMPENAIFSQNFDFNGSISQPNNFTPDYGCTFLTEIFSVRYKMKKEVIPGSYTFLVRGDDGFRLSMDGGDSWIINNWFNGSAQPYQSAEIEIITEGHLDLVLEYYEDKGGNLIDFNFEFQPLILPLEWGEVSARACEQNNCLSWETMQEKNTSHFELERSYDGENWESMDHAVQAQGYATERTAYSFTDKTFMDSHVYYRIKQVDLDATFDYSEVMRVTNTAFEQGFSPYPNPTVDKIRIFSKQEITQVILTSHNLSMDSVLEIFKIKAHVYEVDLRSVKSGYYILTAIKHNAEKETFKVVKQ